MSRGIVVTDVQVEGFLGESLPASSCFWSKIAEGATQCAALGLEPVESQMLQKISSEAARPVAEEALVVLGVEVDTDTHWSTTFNDVVEGSL